MSDSLTRAQYCSLCYTTFTLAWNDAGNCFELRCPRAGCAGSETPTVFIPRAAFAAMDEAKRAALLRLWPTDAEWPAWLLPDLMGSANGTDVRLAFAEMLQGGIIDRRDHRIPPRGEPGGEWPESIFTPCPDPLDLDTLLARGNAVIRGMQEILAPPTIVLGQAEEEVLRAAFEAGGFTVLRRSPLPVNHHDEHEHEQDKQEEE